MAKEKSIAKLKDQLGVCAEERKSILNAIKAAMASASKEMIIEDTFDLVNLIRDKLVLVKAGATYKTDMDGNNNGTSITKSMSPKRLTTYIDVPRPFLAQDSVMANNLLMNDLATAVAVKLQQIVFGKHESTTALPDGFFTGSPTYVCKGIATFGGIVDMESAVDTDNALAENMAYIMGREARGILKKTLRAPIMAKGFIYENGRVNGYKAFTTVSMASGLQSGADEYGIVFGNWADLIIGQWGSLEITVDNLTQATNGAIRLVVNGHFDILKCYNNSFAVGSLN